MASVWLNLPKNIVSQESADLLRPEGVGAGGHASEQRVLQGVLHAKLLKVYSRLGNLEQKRNPHICTATQDLHKRLINNVKSFIRFVIFHLGL